MAILITGLGYIGARLAQDLLAAGQPVVALENFFCTPRAALAELLARPGLQLVRGSINRPATVRAAFATGTIQAVVHLAAQPSANPAAASAHYTELTNLVGARLVLEAAAAAGVGRIVLGSSFKVYGDDLPARVPEQQPYGRVGDLAHLSKIYVEKLAEMLAPPHGLRVVALRLGITHGLGPVVKTDPRFMTVPNRFAQLAAAGQPLTIHPSAIRPAGFLHVAEASAAIRACLAADWPEPYRPVNAVGELATVGQVADHVRRVGARLGLAVATTGPTSPPPAPPRVDSSLPDGVFDPACRLAHSTEAVLRYFLARSSDRSGGGASL